MSGNINTSRPVEWCGRPSVHVCLGVPPLQLVSFPAFCQCLLIEQLTAEFVMNPLMNPLHPGGVFPSWNRPGLLDWDAAEKQTSSEMQCAFRSVGGV